jgi:hypothetical protein
VTLGSAESAAQAEWVLNAKKALQWFIDAMGSEEWHTRRAAVVAYFNKLNSSEIDGQADTLDRTRPFIPYAVYEDWMAWYMYLVESLVDRPACDEPLQSGRIYPFFAAIGRHLNLAQQVKGIEERLRDSLNQRRNQPDSTLFEMLVAICYRRNGWDVRLLPEESGKTPDMEVHKDDFALLVECKRLAKVTEYGERERQQWARRFNVLVEAMRKKGVPTHVEVKFTVPVEDVPLDALASAFTAGRTKAEWFEMAVRNIDMRKIDEHFQRYDVRHGSPQFIELLAGEYDPHGSYTHVYSPTAWATYGEDDGLHVLNLFVRGLKEVYSAKWECVAEDSIDRKAKDIRATLARAVEQVPDDVPSVVHIGYETVSGPLVEFKRHEKIIDTIRTFDFGRKRVVSVFCHALQPLSKVNEFECAETTAFFGMAPGVPEAILPHNLLLDVPTQHNRNGTHWAEDYSARLKNS